MARYLLSRPAAGGGVQPKVRVLALEELPVAVALLAEGMRDNPLHVKAFGEDADRRQQRLHRFLDRLVRHVHAHGVLLGAYVHGQQIGVLGMMKPGHCRPARWDLLRMSGAIVARNPPRGILRIHRWLSAWSRNDLGEPHAHIGPLAVSPAWRRRGVAKKLMRRCCRRLDALSDVAWLETDLATNVAFYETLGFTVVREKRVLGVTNWFMRRDPRR